MAKGIARDEFSIDFPTEDVNRLFAIMEAGARELGKSTPDMLSWTGSLITQSLRSSTKKQKKR